MQDDFDNFPMNHMLRMIATHKNELEVNVLPETYVNLLTNVTLPNSIKNNLKNQSFLPIWR